MTGGHSLVSPTLWGCFVLDLTWVFRTTQWYYLLFPRGDEKAEEFREK